MSFSNVNQLNGQAITSLHITSIRYQERFFHDVSCSPLWYALGTFRVKCAPSNLTLNVRGPSYLGFTRSISWLLMPWLLTSPGHQQPWSLRRHDINSHDIDYVEYVSLGLTWERILSTCAISMWSNDIECKYNSMLPLNNLARKGLKMKPLLEAIGSQNTWCHVRQREKTVITWVWW